MDDISDRNCRDALHEPPNQPVRAPDRVAGLSLFLCAGNLGGASKPDRRMGSIDSLSCDWLRRRRRVCRVRAPVAESRWVPAKRNWYDRSDWRCRHRIFPRLSGCPAFHAGHACGRGVFDCADSAVVFASGSGQHLARRLPAIRDFA